MITKGDEGLSRMEQWALLFTVAFLPFFEAPKNIAVTLFLFFWVVNRFRTGAWGGSWTRFDTAGVALVVSAFLSSLFGVFPSDKGVVAAGDVLTYVLVFLTLRRSRLELTFIARLLGIAILSTSLALTEALWMCKVVHMSGTLELHSVGHVNHSAIYLAIVLLTSLSWAMQRKERTAGRILLWSAAIFLTLGLFFSNARGAIIPALGIFVVGCALLFKGNQQLLLRAFVFMVGLIAISLVSSPGLVEKTRYGLDSGNLGSYRPELARVAIIAAWESPLFGIGLSNFSKITPELIELWKDRNGNLFEGEKFYYSTHAHNLYLTALSERGVAGLAVLLGFLGILGMALFKGRRGIAGGKEGFERVLWGGATGAWLLAVIGGFFNTTLHHEHALVSMILIGSWFAVRRAETGSRLRC